MDAAFVAFRMILKQGVDVRAPKLALVFRERGQIHEIARIRLEFLGAIFKEAKPSLLQDSPFPPEKLAALRGSPMPEIISPINQDYSEPREPRESPGEFFVSGIWRRAVQQREQRHLFTQRPELPRHLVGDIPAKAVSPEIIRPARLQRANIRDVLRRHLFDAPHFLTTVETARFQSVNRLIVSQVTGKIYIAPKHA